ncbi:hypothetical protein ACFFX0_31065 [Citricoccus parietis]|uniref:Uncharacterized protein n=1 Tax=Citricoccus parietis TaxID=592307 RepID=A0ABV5G8Z5_9MICC
MTQLVSEPAALRSVSAEEIPAFSPSGADFEGHRVDGLVDAEH